LRIKFLNTEAGGTCSSHCTTS